MIFQIFIITKFITALAFIILTGDDNFTLNEKIVSILKEIGIVWQMQNDYHDAFGSLDECLKEGTDIKEGKYGWPIIMAITLGNEYQCKILLENYGKDSEICVRRVRNIFKDLNLADIFEKELEKRIENIKKSIHQFSSEKLISPDIFSDIFKKYLDIIL